ncbi:MAG TPA: hypothetical protein VGC74_16325 [Stenotrophomonas sp.]|jgi:hypothetical protein
MSHADTDPIETRLFRRGVSDHEVRDAVELVREYILSPRGQHYDEHQWWSDFALFFEDLTRAFSPAQLTAFEIAADTLLVHAGLQTWTVARMQLTTQAYGGSRPKAA